MTKPQRNDMSQAEFDFAPLSFHKADTGQSIDIVRFVFSLWKPMAIGLCLGGLAGIGLYLLMGPIYSADTQVLVSKRATVPESGREANRYGERGDHVQLIQTDLIVERAFEDHGLNKIPELANAYDPLKEVTESIDVKRSAGQESSFDNVLSITYLHPNKHVARAVVQAMVEAYRDYLNETRDENAKELYKTLLGRQQQLEQDIKRLEGEYQEFRQHAPVFLKASPVVTVNGMATSSQNQYEAELASIETAQNENMRKRSSIQARLATLERRIQENASREALEFWVMHSLSTGTSGGGGGAGGGGGGAIVASAEKGSLDQQLLTARLLEERLLHTLGPDHTVIKNVRRQISTILDFYKRQGLTPPQMDVDAEAPVSSRSAALGMDLVSVYRDTLEGQLREIEADDKNLKLLHEDAKTKAKQAEMFEVQDQHRKDEIAIKKEQLGRLFDQIAEYEISREQEGYRLQQISQVRIERSLKQVIKLVGSMSILGMGLVFCLAYFREWKDQSLKTLDQVRNHIQAPLMGAIPSIKTNPQLTKLAEERGVSPSLCYLLRPGSREAEAYRTIRTTLFAMLKDGQQILQFSSPEPDDGKSTSAANMAVAIAQSGKSVLLVDCDLRRPTQHKIFNTDQEVGLTDVLLQEIEWENAVRPTKVPTLSLMTSGLCPENPSELLSNPMMQTWLQRVRKEYDFVILDTPPILAVSDPCVIAPNTDGMLVVVRMHKTNRNAMKRLDETLSAHGVRVFGVIANAFDDSVDVDAGYNYAKYDAYYSQKEGDHSPVRGMRGSTTPLPEAAETNAT